jgi:hypothetical protein
VPKDLKLSGESEDFTITVVFDTLELYGKVQGARKITIQDPARSPLPAGKNAGKSQ